MNQVIVIGMGGHGKVVADCVRCSGDELLGFLDDREGLPEVYCGAPVLGKSTDWVKYPDAFFVIAIGNANVREMIAQRMAGAKWYIAIHPSAVVSLLGTEIGVGTVILPGAIVNPGACIGRHCILNSTAVVEHDCRIADFVHLAVGAKLGGTVSVGEKTWVGIGATVKNNTDICGGCMLGAGAVVVKDITQPGTYVGVPARKIK